MRRVVVVGAGFAGLAAALTLRRHGIGVVVFEARDRVGGRVHSQALADGSVIELGAEFILPRHETVRRLAEELGLTLYEKGTQYGNREPRGGAPVTRAEIESALDLVGPAARDDEPLPALLGRVGIAAGARDAMLARIEVSTAYRADDQPGTVVADPAARFGDFASHGIAGGNQQLADAMGQDTHLSTRVDRIVWSEGGVIIRAGGAEIEADACVVAVPAFALDGIEFDPPLPEWKLRALAGVRYGRAAKLFLPLASPSAPSATLSVPDRFWTYTQLAPAGTPLPVACSFAGWAPPLTPEAVRALRPDLDYADADPVASTWTQAYSVRSLASPLDDDALAASVGPLAFAGEHTAGAYHALMEGALRSGIRSAEELLASS